MNSTCGASNVSFGLPNREGINGTFLAMAMASGLTSAITNPLLAEVRQSVMAADVLLATTPSAAAGSGPTGWPRPRASRAAGSIAGATRSPPRPQAEPGVAHQAEIDGTTQGAADAVVVFTPSGRRGRFAQGTTVLDAARSLGVDIDSVCGGRGICGRCQVSQGIGEFPEARR